MCSRHQQGPGGTWPYTEKVINSSFRASAFSKYQWLICLCAGGVLLNDKWYNEQPWTWFQHKVSFLNHDVTKNLTCHRMHKEGPQRYQMNRQTNITKTYTSKSPILCARIWFTWLCKALDGLFLGSLEFNGSNYGVSQKKVYNKIFRRRGWNS